MATEHVVVVGAGLAGCMVSLLLARRGIKVSLIEAREDFRQKVSTDEKEGSAGRLTDSVKRSINLALSYRGICALKHVGVFHKVQPQLIEMKGRYMHDRKGDKYTFQPYGQADQAIYSMSRRGLNELLLDELQKLPNVELLFNKSVNRVEKDGVVLFRDGSKVKPTLVIGADGAFSRVRDSLVKIAWCNFSIQHIEAGYKELSIPPINGEFALKNPNGLHIWPRHDFMLIALPNPDKSFTCTLFAPWKGPGGFSEVKTAEDVMKYFEKHFPDVIPLIPNLVDEWFGNPASPLVTVRLSPWYYEDRIVILGDAAHAVVPFYGQGMNAAFEDALLFDELWEKTKGDKAQILKEFHAMREPAANALADLSLSHFLEMRSHTANRLWLFHRRIERFLNWLAPSLWIPEYSLVTFTRTPYHVAQKRVVRQQRILDFFTYSFFLGALGGGAYAIAKLLARRSSL